MVTYDDDPLWNKPISFIFCYFGVGGECDNNIVKKRISNLHRGDAFLAPMTKYIRVYNDVSEYDRGFIILVYTLFGKNNQIN